MSSHSNKNQVSLSPHSSQDVMVIGSLGMLGRDLLSCLAESGLASTGADLPEIDIARHVETFSLVKKFSPKVLINCAAYTAVDKAESEPVLAFTVNRDGPCNLAEICRELKIPFIHISTDYVFDGLGSTPYREEDPANPLGIYAKSKWQGEERIRSALGEHLIIRTAWLYGVHGENFVKTMIRLSREREEIRVVDDQFGSPTWTRDLSSALCRIAGSILKGEQGKWGTYHFCGKGKTSWFEFARKIVEETRKREIIKTDRVVPIPTEAYPTPARRPPFSVLDCSKIEKSFGVETSPWELSLSKMMDLLYSTQQS